MRALCLYAGLAVMLFFTACESTKNHAVDSELQPMRRIVVAPDKRGFVFAGTQEPFRPWGMNYGNSGRLMEDFWDGEWETFAGDFRELRALGANVVRVHLQFGRFMDGPESPNPIAILQLRRMLRLAE